jgi:hypothetical protein
MGLSALSAGSAGNKLQRRSIPDIEDRFQFESFLLLQT